MDRPTDELLTRVLRSAAALSEERAAELVSEARAEAEAEVKAILKSAMKAAMLDRAAAALESRSASPTVEPAKEEPERADLTATGTYVYAIARFSERNVPKFAAGVAAVQLLGHEDLQAIVSHVPIDGFGTAEQLRDLDWISRHVQAHDEVIKSAMGAGPVIPLRFCTVFRDDQRVLELIARHHKQLRRTLDALAGKSEWGVKLHLDRRASAASSNGHDAPSGREYLVRKRRSSKTTRQHDQSEAAQPVIEDVQQTLGALAVEAATLPLRENDADPSLRFNGAFLVADGRLNEFRAAVRAIERRHATEGARLELSGPWPAYNFVRLDLSSEAEAVTA